MEAGETRVSITVELAPEVEERLRMQAAAQGVPLPEYVECLIRQAAGGLVGERPTLAEFEADWAGFAAALDHVAPLPLEAFSREGIYGESD